MSSGGSPTPAVENAALKLSRESPSWFGERSAALARCPRSAANAATPCRPTLRRIPSTRAWALRGFHLRVRRRIWRNRVSPQNMRINKQTNEQTYVGFSKRIERKTLTLHEGQAVLCGGLDQRGVLLQLGRDVCCSAGRGAPSAGRWAIASPERLHVRAGSPAPLALRRELLELDRPRITIKIGIK